MKDKFPTWRFIGILLVVALFFGLELKCSVANTEIPTCTEAERAYLDSLPAGTVEAAKEAADE